MSSNMHKPVFLDTNSSRKLRFRFELAHKQIRSRFRTSRFQLSEPDSYRNTINIGHNGNTMPLIMFLTFTLLHFIIIFGTFQSQCHIVEENHSSSEAIVTNSGNIVSCSPATEETVSSEKEDKVERFDSDQFDFNRDHDIIGFNVNQTNKKFKIPSPSGE